MNKNFIKVVAAVLSLLALLRADNALKLVSQSEISVNNIAEINTLSYRSCYSKPELFDVPDYDTSFKTYMNYKAITNKNSKQYKLQKLAYTDDNGFRRIDDDYLVAMGTYYSDTCGERFKITFEDGHEITVMIGDIKNDLHTNSTNQYTAVYNSNGEFISANVLEFIVDTSLLSKKAKNLGSVNCYEELCGNISTIEKIKGELT